MSAPAAPSTFNKDNPFSAKLTENRVLNKPGSAKETRHFIVSLEGSDLKYKAGDSLGVFPKNRPADVAELVERLGASGEELVSPAMLKLPTPIKLHEALTNRLSLSKPTRKILETLAAKATDAGEKARLTEWISPEAKERVPVYLEEREFIDVLNEYPSAKPTPQEFVDHLRKLMPRLYSIASSSKAFPNEIHLTVAIVRYHMTGRDRVGVCSTFLAERVALNSPQVPVFVSDSHFGPPADGAKDAIMVGPGTGIAPFRAFVQDRIATGATGRNWVFFGDQKHATDYLYQEEWTDYVAKGQVHKLDLAWSRDQILKVYVQDKMRESGAELWAWIKNGGYFFVCGDAKRMAKDVDVALHDVIVQHGGMTTEQAVEYVKQMKKDKRYQRDVY